MATAVRDSTLVAGGSGTGTNTDTPAGTTAGDTVYVFGHINNNPTWVDNNGANALTKDVAYEPATNEALHSWSLRPSSGNISGWGGTPDFTAGASTRWTMAMVAISDPHPTDLFDVTPSTTYGQFDSTGASTTITTKDITATRDCLLFVWIGADGNTTTITTTSMTDQGFTVLENGGNQAGCLLVKQVAAGAVGALSFTSAVPAATQWITMVYLVPMNVTTSTGSGGSSQAAQLTEGKGTSTATGFGATTQAAQVTAATGKATATGSGGSSAAAQASAAVGASVASGKGGSTAAVQVTSGKGIGLEGSGSGGSSAAAQLTAATGSAVATGTGGSSSAGQASAGKGTSTMTGTGGSSNPAQVTGGKGAVAAVGSGGSTAAPQFSYGNNPGGDVARGGSGGALARRRLPPREA